MVFEPISENEWCEIVAALQKPWPETACRIDLRILGKSRWPGLPKTQRELAVRWGVSKTTAWRYVEIERSGVR